MRVLMVDDHMLVLQGVQTLLAVLAPAIAMDTSPDMDDALRRLARRRYDLVLLDWQLPGIDGGELASLFKRDRMLKDTPVLFLTALVNESDTRGK